MCSVTCRQNHYSCWYSDFDISEKLRKSCVFKDVTSINGLWEGAICVKKKNLNKRLYIAIGVLPDWVGDQGLVVTGACCVGGGGLLCWGGLL